MPENQHREEAERAAYETMRTEELQQILREDASKPLGEESDTDALLCMMEVLAKRRNERNEGKTPEEALGSFKANYCTEKRNSFDSESDAASGKHRIAGRWKKNLIAAAAAICLIVAGNSITAHALGVDLWQIIAKWTQETFHFEFASGNMLHNEPIKEDTSSYTGLREFLLKFDVSVSLAPMWLPDGYEEIEIKVEDTPMQRRFVARYQCENDTIRIRVVDYINDAPTQIEQSDSLVEIYTHSEVNYYIFENSNQLQAVWTIGNYECFISGPLTLSEIKGMIDSIEKG